MANELDETVVVCVSRGEETVQSIDVNCSDCETELCMSVVSYLELAERGTKFEPVCAACAFERSQDTDKVVRQMITRKTYDEAMRISGMTPEEMDRKLEAFGIEKEWEQDDE